MVEETPRIPDMDGCPRNTVYDADFYADTVEWALRSARTIVPILLKQLSVRSAVDIGCGCGAWLRALEECGITDVVGYDGDYVDRSVLLVDSAKFKAVDLCGGFELSRTFDLAISLEVAEHLPSQFAVSLIQRLVWAAPIVLFSAAIPGQPGTHHINLQWQDYWRSLFGSFNYKPVDFIRPMVWGNLEIDYWYQQNIVLYVSDGALSDHSGLERVRDDISLNLVHPALYEWQLSRILSEVQRSQTDFGLKQAIHRLPFLTWDAAARRLRRFVTPKVL